MPSKRRPNHLALALIVVETGFEMSLPCDFCLSNNKSCVLSEHSKNCSECIRVKKSCSLSSAPSDRELASFLRDFDRIERERTSALEEAIEAQAKAAQAQAKAFRLERQAKFLRKRGGQLLHRGSEALGSENSPEHSSSRVPVVVESATSPSSGLINPEAYSASFWESVGVVENPPTPPAPSSGAP